MNEDFLKIIGMIIVVGFFIYLVVKSMKLQTSILEGLTNPDAASSSASTSDALSQNKSSGAQAYADEISKLYAKMSDSLLIKDNRTAYENVVIQMDDFINTLMLQKIMSVNKNSMTEEGIIDIVQKINTLNEGKRSLNSIMKFIDGV